jgi:hypothetical protein
MTRYFLYFLLSVTVISCKKKSCEQEILPDTVINPTYQGQISSSLTYNIKNGNIDTLLGFNGYLIKNLNGQGSVEQFISIVYNSSTVQFDNLPNFMANANNSNWTITSDLIGNFNYSDHTLMPNSLNCGTLNPSVGKFSGLNLNLTGITNTSRVIVEVRDMTFINPYSNSLEIYNLQGASSLTTSSNSQSYANFMGGANIGNDVLLTITLENMYKKENLNGHDMYFTKSTIYRFPTKIVN